MKRYWKWIAVSGLMPVCVIAFASGTDASAATADPPIGAWAGQSMLGAGTAKSRPMAVNLTLADSSGEAAGPLRFGLPKRCTAQLKDAARAADGSWSLSVVDANGGSCDALIGKMLKLGASANGTLTFTVGGISGNLGPVASYRPLAWNGDWSDPASATSGSVLRVHLDASQPGGQASSWRYGAPRSCSLVAEYSGTADSTIYLAFANSNGGYCDRLVGDYVKLDASEDKVLHYGIYLPDGVLLNQGNLQRTGK